MWRFYAICVLELYIYIFFHYIEAPLLIINGVPTILFQPLLTVVSDWNDNVNDNNVSDWNNVSD